MGLLHEGNVDGDNTMNFADQDEKDNHDVFPILFPTRHEVVVGPSQAQPLCDLNRDGDTCEENAGVVRHSAEQAQLAVVKVDIQNRVQMSEVLLVKLISTSDGHDYSRDLSDGDDHHFLDHPMVVVVEDVAGASSGDPLVHHPHEGGHRGIQDTPLDCDVEACLPPSEQEVYEEEHALSRQELQVAGVHP